MEDGEAEIFLKFTDPFYLWLWISAPTRYGKTETIALAIIFCAVFYHLKIPIVGGSESKAKKIMDYIVAHLGDHPDLYAGLINIQDVQDVDKLKITVSKDALRWHDGGWIFITSIDARSIVSEGEGVVGEGGDIVVLEEAGLIKRPEQFSKVVRMPEEGRGWGKLVMSGNCIEKSVFEAAYNDPKYHKVRISLGQALLEKRFTRQALVNKKSDTTTKDWKRYYLVKFPSANEFTFFKPNKYLYLPKKLKYYGALDPSLGGAKKQEVSTKGSKIGIVVLGREEESGQVFEVDSAIEHMKPGEAVRKIFNLPYKFERFVIEAIQFQKYFIEVTDELSKKNKLYIPFEGISQSKNKVERIESMEPHISNEHILFKGDNQLWDDMQDYPDTEFLDGLDALEMAWRAMTGGDVSYSFA